MLNKTSLRRILQSDTAMLSTAIISLLFLFAAEICAQDDPGRFAGRERRWEALYGDELYELIRERPLAWLPLGILEKHGDHLPWGLDGLKAHKACLRMADKLGGVVLPPQHLLGVHGDLQPGRDEVQFRKFHREVGDFMFREETFRRWLIEAYDGLENIGFEVIVAYTGHYPEIQTRIVMETAGKWNAVSGAAVIPFWEPLACGEGDHGGKWESSIWMALEPAGVRLYAARDEETGREGWYRGVPVRKESSREFGEKALKMIESYLGEKIEAALNRK